MMKNPKIVLLVLGIVVGGAIGYMTRPETAEIRIGKLNIQLTGKGINGRGDSLTSDQYQHIALFALIGGALGLGLGVAVGSGRIRF